MPKINEILNIRLKYALAVKKLFLFPSLSGKNVFINTSVTFKYQGQYTNLNFVTFTRMPLLTLVGFIIAEKHI